MGHWSLPNKASDANILRNVISGGISARDASDILYDILGSDTLFDRLDKAIRKHPDSDVSSLVVNAVAEIYFTGIATDELATTPAGEILRDIVDSRTAGKHDVFFLIAKIQNEVKALDRFAHWLEIDRADRSNWDISRDPNGYDFIARNEAGTLFRLSAIDDYVVEIDASNAEIYATLFDAAPAPAR
ncbi:hypothetical protein G6L37_35035 [Agrobacterium rubi]|nr:hypothetical protein [Agrobacterium rubi]NTF23785.1 hypothetical protein [Agrobacterium rubi]